ncbi:MAG TPA: glycosyltransferase family 2 protein [Cyclobacteriaceae bacterium]|nr:glycosyltransferase family 2 protein [Cyclobacteriaceae bacterium]
MSSPAAPPRPDSRAPGRAIGVVILNYNGRSHLENFLGTVVRYSDDATIIVADNGSTDDSLNFISKNFPTVAIIDIGDNLGFCGGYNFALKKVEADYYVLLNNDVEVTEGWLRPLKQLLDDDSSIAAVQPKILSWRRKDLFEYAGAGGGFIDTLGYPFCRGRLFRTLEKDRGQYNDTVPVFWATGACLVVRAKLFHELGGLDKDFFAHMEEIDLCWRLKRLGHKVYYCGKSTVYHVGGGTLSEGSPTKTYYNFRNGLVMLIKNQSAAQLFWKLPLRIVLDWVAALQLLFTSPASSWAVFRAHFYVLFHLGRVFDKRRGPFRVTEMWPGILVWHYFALGKRTWKALNSPK